MADFGSVGDAQYQFRDRHTTGGPSGSLADPQSEIFRGQALSPMMRWFHALFFLPETLFQNTRRPQIEEWGTLAIPIWPQLRPAGEFGAGSEWDGKIRISWPIRFTWPNVFMMEDSQGGSGGGKGSDPLPHEIAQELENEKLVTRIFQDEEAALTGFIRESISMFSSPMPPFAFQPLENGVPFKLEPDSRQGVRRIVFNRKLLGTASEKEWRVLWSQAYELNWFEGALLNSAKQILDSEDAVRILSEENFHQRSHRADYLLRSLRIDFRGKDVIDAGAGLGGMTWALAQQGAHVTWVDGLPKMQMFAEKYISGNSANAGQPLVIDYQVGGLSDLKTLVHRQYDFVVVEQTAHLFPPGLRKHILRQMLDVLKPGGSIIVFNPELIFESIGWFDDMDTLVEGDDVSVRYESLGDYPMNPTIAFIFSKGRSEQENVPIPSVVDRSAAGANELPPGLSVTPIQFTRPVDGQPRALRGEVWRVDLSKIAATQRWAENYRVRDLADEFHQDNDPNIGRTVEEYVQQDEHPNEVVLAVNNTQEHFVMNNTLLVHEGQMIMTPKGRRDLSQAYLKASYQPPHGIFHILSLDPHMPGIFDIELDQEGNLIGGLPVGEGFAGPLILRNGEPTIDGQSGIRFGQKLSLTGGDVNWTPEKRQAFSAMGYDHQGRLVIVQLAGATEDPEQSDPALEEFISVLQSHGVRDAVLTGTSADVQRYAPAMPQPFIWTRARKTSLLEKAFGTSRGRRIGTALLFRLRGTPGALGFWQKLGIHNLRVIGFIEGVIGGVAAAFDLWFYLPHGLQSVALIPLGLHLTGFLLVGFLSWIALHYHFGVQVTPHLAARRHQFGLSVRAAVKASAGFVGIPLIVLGILSVNPFFSILIGLGILAGAIFHGVLNPEASSITREQAIDMLRGGWIEVGLHTTTSGKGHRNATVPELIAMGQKLLNHHMMPGIDHLEVLRALRANPANNDKLICFLLEGQPGLAEEAAAAGANVLNGQGLTREVITGIRQKYPQVIFIEDISRDEGAERMTAHLAEAQEAGVDGVLLKPFFQGETSWLTQFPEGPLSLAGIRAAHPDWVLMSAGGVFQHRAAGVLALSENLTPAVGLNPAGDFDEQLAEYDFVRADGRTRGSGKVEEFTLDSWQDLTVEAQQRVLNQAIERQQAGDLSRAVALLAPLEQGKPLRVAFVLRGLPLDPSDPFASVKDMMGWQQRTVNKQGGGFFKVQDDGRTIDIIHTPMPGLENQSADHLVNLGLAAKPGGGSPAAVCFLCLDTIRSTFPDELWRSWGSFNYYLNPFPLWPPKPGDDIDKMPVQLVAAWNDGHRSQQEASDPKVIRELRRQWMQLNASPGLRGNTKYRMMINGWSYGDPEVHGGASQNHIHGQMMRVPFKSEKAPIEWRGTMPGTSVRAGRVLLLTDPDRIKADDVYGVVLEAGKGPADADQLDEALAQLLKTMTRQGHSFDVLFYETESSIRAYVTGRVHGKPEGSLSGRATAEVLARENVVISQFERVYALTEEQRTKLAELPPNEYRVWLQAEFAAGRLTRRPDADIYADYYKEIRQVAYSAAQVEGLLAETVTEQPRVVLLDMGNVMVPIDPVRIVDQLTERGGLSETRMHEVWDAASYHWRLDLINQYMVGRISSREFFERMKAELGLSSSLTFDHFKEIWQQFVAEQASMKMIDVDAIRQLRRQGYKIYGFSNTDPIHHDLVAHHPAFRETLVELDGFYPSYTLGGIKPDPRVYSAILENLRYQPGLKDLRPGQILFVDDNRLNINTGDRQGWQTVLFQGQDHLFEELAERDFARADGSTRGSGKVEESILISWRDFPVETQQKMLETAMARHQASDPSRSVVLRAPLEQGKPLRVAFVPPGSEQTKQSTGTMFWLKDWLFPHLSDEAYSHLKAWWAEIIPAILAGIPLALQLAPRFTGHAANLPTLTVGMALAFVVEHLIDWIVKGFTQLLGRSYGRSWKQLFGNFGTAIMVAAIPTAAAVFFHGPVWFLAPIIGLLWLGWHALMNNRNQRFLSAMAAAA